MVQHLFYFLFFAIHSHILLLLAQLKTWEGTNKRIDLQPFIQSKQLIVKSHPFFNSGHPCKNMREFASTKSTDLYPECAQQDLIVYKGDANYRRLMGEQQWKETDSFDMVGDYLPSPTLAIRTLKYPLSCGASLVNVNKAKQMYGQEEWNCVGKCGVIHFKQ